MEGQAETCPCYELSAGSVFVVLIFVVSDRPQEVGEGPLGYASALLACLLVCKAEVDALIDAGVDHISSRIRESGIGARLLNRRWVISGHQKVIWSVPKKRASTRVTAPVTLLAPEV